MDTTVTGNTAQPAFFDHADPLASLGEQQTFEEKLVFLHHYLRRRCSDIDRIALVLYDGDTGILKTFAHSTLGGNPLPHYEIPLAASRTLSTLVKRRRPRVINDLDLLDSQNYHTRKIREGGYAASYTIPIFRNGELYGIQFYNSRQRYAFNEGVLSCIDLVAHLLSLSLIDHLTTSRALVASVRGASTLARHRDFETGAHLDRMAHYSRLIARTIAPKYGLDDVTIEHIFLFSPLHDIGKIAIPDSILFKPGKLDAEEFATMKRHPEQGAEMIDALLDHFGLSKLPHAPLLRNIALFHHEAMNGQGYPHGLKGDEIPLEARVAAVADVFDALTSARPYKAAWSVDEAFALLEKLAGDTLDKDCVNALIGNRAEVERIKSQFAEDSEG